MKNKSSLGLTLGLIAFFLWSIPPVLTLSLVGEADFFQITFYVHVFGLLAVGLISSAFYRGEIKNLFSLNSKSIILLSLSGSSQAICYLCFYYAIQNSSATGATVVHNIWPIFLIILSQFYSDLKVDINAYQKALIFLAFVGAVLIILDRGAGSSIELLNINILFAVASAFFGALNSLFYREARSSLEKDLKVSSLSVGTHVIMLIPRIGLATLLLSIGLFFYPHSMALSTDALLKSAFMGAFVYAIGHFLYSYSLHNAKLSTLSVASYLTPIFSLVMLTILMEVNLTAIASVGAALVILSVHQMQNNTKFLNIYNAFPLAITITSAIIVLFHSSFRPFAVVLHNVTSEYVDLAAAIFSILIGFFLARSADLNKEAAESSLSINNTLKSLWIKLDESKDAELIKQLDLVAELILEIDLLPACKEKYNKCNRLLEVTSEVSSFSFLDSGFREDVQTLDQQVRSWALLENSYLSLPERASVWTLGIIVSISLVTDVSSDITQRLIALIITTVVLILCIAMRDLDNDWKSNDIQSIKVKTTYFQSKYGNLFIPYAAIKEKTINLPEHVQDYVTKKDGIIKYDSLDNVSNLNQLFGLTLISISICLSLYALINLS